MKHDYTNDEIRDAWKDSVSLCEFLDALPERPQAQPGPWPGQQEAIDAAMIEASKVNGAHYDLFAASPHRWPGHWLDEAPARLAVAQAYDAARPQADEIAALKVERDKWEADALRYCKNADFWRSEHDKAQSELAAMPKPILADDGRSLIDIYGDAFDVARVKRQLPMKECCDSGFKAVEAAVLAQAVRRMEEVPKEEIWKVYKDDPHPFAQEALDAVRARLIAAVKGEGQAKPVVVNEPLHHERQPDLSGESEKQTDDPAQAQQDPAQPWTPAVGDTVRLKSGGPVMTVHYIAKDGSMGCVHNANGHFEFTTVPAACLTQAQP